MAALHPKARWLGLAPPREARRLALDQVLALRPKARRLARQVLALPLHPREARRLALDQVLALRLARDQVLALRPKARRLLVRNQVLARAQARAPRVPRRL